MKSIVLVLGLFAAPAFAQSALDPLESLELDVVDQRERPDDAIQRMSAKPPSKGGDDEDPGYKHLKMDWGLGGDDLPIISESSLAPLPVEDAPTILEEAHDRGHGHAYAHGKDKDKDKGEGDGGDKDDGKDDGKEDKDDGKDKGDKDGDGKKKGGKG